MTSVLETPTPQLATTAAAPPSEDDLGGLEPIGLTCGELLLQLLELNGWTIHRRRAFAGNGVLLIATHPDGHDIQAEGPTIAAAATPLFTAAATRRPPTGEEQLGLF